MGGMVWTLALACALTERPPADPYLDAALRAAAWIRAERGRQSEEQRKDLSLYSGEAGVLVFFCELAHATKDPKVVAEVRQLADRLSAKVEGTKDPGLYTGLSGAGFALDCAAELTKDLRYVKAGNRAIQRAFALAKPWLQSDVKDASNDIISGLAGIGCAVVRHTEVMDAFAASEPNPTQEQSARESSELRTAAKAIGERLLAVAKQPTSDARFLMWEMSPGYPREMPNFSHGTAGVAYFLARLGAVTNEAMYLDAAKKGAAYILSLTGKDRLIFHHKPDGEDLKYLGWCHGPVGTSRLFALLHRQTKQRRYGRWIDQAAEALTACGIPEQRTPGFWNNYGYCCGDAGVLRFFLDLHRLDGKPEQLAFAKRLAGFLIAKGEKADGLRFGDPPPQGGGGLPGEGLKWTFAENRVSPKDVKAQTGLMQGAPGIGLALLWLHEFEAKQEALVRFPDAPWRW